MEREVLVEENYASSEVFIIEVRKNMGRGCWFFFDCDDGHSEISKGIQPGRAYVYCMGRFRAGSVRILMFDYVGFS